MTIDTNNLIGTQDAGRSGSAGSAVGANGDVSQLFTTLLVAQIRNQNPLEPTDPSAFVTQLTQLSQMEALQSLAKQGQANGAALESLQVLQLGGQIGSQVMVQTETLAVNGEPVRGQLTLANGTDAVSLVLESDSGRQVRVPLGTRGAGVVPFTLDPAALGLVDGIYTIRAETSEETAAPPVEVQGVLRGVKLSPAGGVTVAISSVGDTTPAAITAFNGRPAGH